MTTIARAVQRGTFTAPALDSFRGIGHDCLQLHTEKEQETMNRLASAFQQIQPYNDDDCYTLYFSLHRGTIEDFGDVQEAIEWGEVENEEEFKQWFLESYPKKEKWYELTGVFRNGYMGLILNHRMLVEYNPFHQDSYFEEMELHHCFLLEHLTSIIQKCVQMLKEGTYNNYVNQNISFEMKTGTIYQKDYWKIYPEHKEEMFKGLSEENFRRLCQVANSDFMSKEGNLLPVTRMKSPTANTFFEACLAGYLACHYDVTDCSPKEAYLRYADGRDEGLTEIDGDSPEAFKDWYLSPERRGGHPYEICRGGNSTHIDLFIMRDNNGWYFMVQGRAWTRCAEATNIFLELYKRGYPVGLYDARYVAERFAGESKMGIVPRGVTPAYCESYFPDEEIHDFINLWEEDYEKLKDDITWLLMEEVKLAETKK